MDAPFENFFFRSIFIVFMLPTLKFADMIFCRLPIPPFFKKNSFQYFSSSADKAYFFSIIISTLQFTHQRGLQSFQSLVPCGIKFVIKFYRTLLKISVCLFSVLIESSFTINPFQVNVPFLCLLKRSENLWCSVVFKGYRKGTLVWIGLNRDTVLGICTEFAFW